MSAINDLIDRMTEAEYLSMVDMKWVADRLREFAEEQAHKPMAPASLVEELKKQIRSRSYADENDECNGQVIPVCDLLKIISRYTQEEKPTANADMVEELSAFIEHAYQWHKSKKPWDDGYGSCLASVGEILSKYRPVKAPADEGLGKMLYKKLYPYPCGEHNNRIRLDGSSLDIWFTKDEVDTIVARHKASDKGVK